jgi:ribose-phosphate pyrophosphokinase
MTKRHIILGRGVSANLRTKLAENFALTETKLGAFKCGEPFVQLSPHSLDHSLKGEHITIIWPICEPLAQSLIQLFLLLGLIKEQCVKTMTLVLPYAPFARQDHQDPTFLSCPSQALAKLLRSVGIDRLAIITAHSLAQLEFFYHEFADSFSPLRTTELFASDIAARFEQKPIAIGCPDGADKPKDLGQGRAAEVIAALQNHSSTTFNIIKARGQNQLIKSQILNCDVAGKHCLLIDDIIDSGQTITNAATLLRNEGALAIYAYATHGVFSSLALKTIFAAGIQGLVVTDTIPSAAFEIAKFLTANSEFSNQIYLLSTADIITNFLKTLP